MPFLKTVLLAGALLASSPVGAQVREQCFEALCVVTETRGEVTTLTARNTLAAAPISVALQFRLDNMTARGTGQAVLGPGTSRRLVELRPRGPGTWQFQFDYAWMPGDYRAQPDPRAIYLLPFRRAALPVVQSCGGWFSHRDEAKQAVDFAMPVGTPVHATRAGHVIYTKMDSQRGGASRRYLNDDNKVLVQHDDGSVAAYAHLSFGSARVVPGQRVEAGDLLALSGNTGFSAQPHLHFELYTPTPDGGRRSWPVTWNVGGQPVVCPKRGQVLRN